MMGDIHETPDPIEQGWVDDTMGRRTTTDAAGEDASDPLRSTYCPTCYCEPECRAHSTGAPCDCRGYEYCRDADIDQLRADLKRVEDERDAGFQEFLALQADTDNMAMHDWREWRQRAEKAEVERDALCRLAYGCPDCGNQHTLADCTTLQADVLRAENEMLRAELDDLRADLKRVEADRDAIVPGIVAWLRDDAPAPYNIADADHIIGYLADAIERDEWKAGRNDG